MAMNLPTGPGASGGFNGTVQGIGSGLAGLLQGLVQGRLLRNQEQQQQETLQGDKMRNALSLYQIVSQIGQADPDALNSPALKSYLQQNTQGSIPLPTDATGNIDTNAFRTPLSSLTQGPGYEKFLSLPKGSDARKQMLTSYGGTPEQKQQLVDLDQQLSPAESDNANTQLRYLRDVVTTQGLDPDKSPGWQQQWNYYANLVGQPQYTPGMFKASDKTVATIKHLDSETNKNNATVAWMNKLNPVRMANLEASTGLKREQLQYLPMRLAIMADNAATARGRLKVAQDQLDMAKQTFSKLGMTPQGLSAYDGVVKGLGETVNQERQALSAVQGNIAKLKQAGLPSADSQKPEDKATLQIYTNMLSEEQHLQAKLGTDSAQFKKFNDGRQTYAQSLQQHVLNKQGAPPSWKPTPQTTPKTITQAGLQQFAKDHKVTLDQAKQQAQAAGYTIQP